jgi:hypothetical protein
MNKILFYILIIINLSSCVENTNEQLKLVVINGKIVDSTRKTNYTNYQITANFFIDNRVKIIGNAVVDSNGEFKIEYYSNNNYVGNNLRLTFSPTIPRSYKFDFLPYGTNWSKVFYLSDSAKIVFKNKINFIDIDTVTLFTNPRIYSYIVSKNTNYIGETRVVNVDGNMLYKINSMPNSSIYINPTGDPIVDTITLDINP